MIKGDEINFTVDDDTRNQNKDLSTALSHLAKEMTVLSSIEEKNRLDTSDHDFSPSNEEF
jgi:hypothetical protein